MPFSSYVIPLQCCRLCWYQGTASSMLSIQCCLASATLYSRMSHTCRRMPPSQNPFLRPTQCPPISHIHRETVTQTHQEAVAAPPFLIHHPALTPAVHSRCQVRSNSELSSTFLLFQPYGTTTTHFSALWSSSFRTQRLPLLPTCPQRNRWLRIVPSQWTLTSWLHPCLSRVTTGQVTMAISISHTHIFVFTVISST